MRKNRKIIGTSMIEFALVAPIVTTLLVGILEFSMLFYDQIILTVAAREGARYGVLPRSGSYATSTQVINYTTTYCTNNLITFSTTTPTLTITSTPSAQTQAPNTLLTVVVTYTYTDLVLHNFFTHGSQYILSSTAVMGYE